MATRINVMGLERQAGGRDWGDGRTSVSRCFVRDMEGLWSELLKFAAVVEEALDGSVRALRDGRVDQAQEVKRRRRLADRWEMQIEQECIRVLALHQPVASDLRRVASALKINGDLHRLCDLARHIAKRVKKLATEPQSPPIPQALEELGLEALEQVHDSLDALTRADVALARAVIDADRRVDRDYRAVQKQLKQEIGVAPQRAGALLRLVNTARNLERIADHAVKIAEAVIYLEQGEAFRHSPAGGEAGASVTAPVAR